MENALQVLFLGGMGGVAGYVIAQALKRRRESGEEGASDRVGARNTDPRRWGSGPGVETEVLARIETLERAFQEQNQEVTARFNRLAARSRRREPAGEPGPVDETARPLTRKDELRAKVSAARQASLPLSVRQAISQRGGEDR